MVKRHAPVISVILPCLNEEAAIGGVVDEAWAGIGATELAGEVVVVDNGSSDRSAELAQLHGARVVREPRRGYGNAYLAGLAAAEGEFLVMADADGSYDLRDLTPFVSRLQQGSDLVLGSRLRGSIHPGAMPWLNRRVGNPILTAFLNVLFHVRVSDAHCGLRAIRRSALARVNLQSAGMEFASEMIVKAAKRRLVIAEVPIEYRRRIGWSKLNRFRDAWGHVRFLLVHSPTFLFLIPGLVLLTVGAIVLLGLAGGPVDIFGRSWQIHTMIAGSAATVVGAQIIELGVFARTYAILYLGEEEPILQRLWMRIRLEHGLLLGGTVLLAGVGLLGEVFARWAASGFGPLGHYYASILGLTLVGLGVQILFASFFLSILGLPRHVLLEPSRPRLAPALEERMPAGLGSSR
ncbi:MAG TPA: glycosyltransferase family 2 protein [Gaiellaceae bacterium]|nr:glycosyltransferase family 2 protein [Gaiellaceae bacterium]